MMRYRPFGISGKAVSAISIVLRENVALPNPAAWRGFIFEAMEWGVNAFEMVAGSEVVSRGLASALEAVERRLVFLSLRIEGDQHRPLTADSLSLIIRTSLQRTGAAYFDVLMLDEIAFRSLDERCRVFLGDVCAAGLVLQVGVGGDGDCIDAAIRDPIFQVVASPFSLVSGWNVRRRVKEAADANMALMAYDVWPPALMRPAKAAPAGGGLLRRTPAPLARAGAYAFLHATQGWTAAEICLAYALTEPSFATVQIETVRPEVVVKMAAVPERDLPTGVAAQIEMARFGGDADAAMDSRRA